MITAEHFERYIEIYKYMKQKKYMYTNTLTQTQILYLKKKKAVWYDDIYRGRLEYYQIKVLHLGTAERTMPHRNSARPPRNRHYGQTEHWEFGYLLPSRE